MKQIKKKLPIGIENFAKLQAEDFYYVDKTMLIKELLDNWAEVNLFTRPRRFGKTLNMNMLKAFFELNGDKNCFKGTRISREVYLCEQYMGKFPVIFISLKSISAQTYEKACDMAIQIVNGEARRFQYLLDSERLTEYDKDAFKSLLLPDMKESVLCSSLRILSELLEKHHGQKVILLIDEYDVPLAKAFELGYYNSMTLLIRNLFENALKTNDSLKFAVLTGCMRISKESIFTGLNNLKVLSVADVQFDEYFGFTDSDVKNILEYYELSEHYDEIKIWYDGYRFGLTEIYNPWSVLNCIDSYLQNDMVACEPYWSNTSSNRIVKRLIEESNERTKSMVEELINGTPIHTQIFEDVTYGTIDVNQDYIWSFLLFTGYLKIISCETVGDETYYDMVIPNVEIKSIYKNTIRSWFIDHINRDSRTDILESVIHADAEKLEDLLCTWLTNTISCFDEQENYYHGFVTGLVSGFNGYMVVSNRESGNGRFDLVVKQRSRWHHAAILEFKVVEKYNQMTKACEDALRQIEEKDYEASLRDEQYENIAKLGICFCQKRCRVKSGGVDHFEY